MSLTTCVFCDYAGPSEVLAEYAHSVVFEPINPVIPGHVLVVPKRMTTRPPGNSTRPPRTDRPTWSRMPRETPSSFMVEPPCRTPRPPRIPIPREVTENAVAPTPKEPTP